jgi:hypothetical protein
MKFKRDIVVALSTVLVMFTLYRVLTVNPSDKGVKLEENAAKLYLMGDARKDNADKIKLQVQKLEEKIKLKDSELSSLYGKLESGSHAVTMDDLRTTVDKQKEAIELRDQTISSLKAENIELRIAMSNNAAAYEVQLMATAAYKEAMAEAQWKAGFKGVVAGVILGFVAGK